MQATKCLLDLNILFRHNTAALLLILTKNGQNFDRAGREVLWASVTAHQWSIRPTCHPARSLQLIGIRPIRSGAIIAHECDRKQARDPTFITGRRSFFSWRRTGTIIRRVMAGVVMEGGIPHRGSPSPYNQHRVIKIANLYTDRSTEFRTYLVR